MVYRGLLGIDDSLGSQDLQKLINEVSIIKGALEGVDTELSEIRETEADIIASNGQLSAETQQLKQDVLDLKSGKQDGPLVGLSPIAVDGREISIKSLPFLSVYHNDNTDTGVDAMQYRNILDIKKPTAICGNLPTKDNMALLSRLSSINIAVTVGTLFRSSSPFNLQVVLRADGVERVLAEANTKVFKMDGYSTLNINAIAPPGELFARLKGSDKPLASIVSSYSLSIHERL